MPITYEIYILDITMCFLYSAYLRVGVTTVYSVLPVVSVEICGSLEALLLE